MAAIKTLQFSFKQLTDSPLLGVLFRCSILSILSLFQATQLIA